MEKIDARLPLKRAKTTMGERVVSMIYNGLGFIDDILRVKQDLSFHFRKKCDIFMSCHGYMTHIVAGLKSRLKFTKTSAKRWRAFRAQDHGTQRFNLLSALKISFAN